MHSTPQRNGDGDSRNTTPDDESRSLAVIEDSNRMYRFELEVKRLEKLVARAEANGPLENFIRYNQELGELLEKGFN